MSLSTPDDFFVPKRDVYNKDDLRKYYAEAMDACLKHHRRLTYGNPWIKAKADALLDRQKRAIYKWDREQRGFMSRMYGDDYFS